MSISNESSQVCIIIGASHAGVNCAFALRKEGWTGKIILIDADPHLPYHRPPLSKTYLASASEDLSSFILKSEDAYEQATIELKLGLRILKIDRIEKVIISNQEERIAYDKLVLAVGARAYIPPIQGIQEVENVFSIREAKDIKAIQNALKEKQQILIIGGGYIGLETAASLKKLGAQVKVLERESRILARVTTDYLSDFIQTYHEKRGVGIHLKQEVVSVNTGKDGLEVNCKDGSVFHCDILIVGVGIQVNTNLAEEIKLKVENGICVNQEMQTTDSDIYAIGDCTLHYNPHYKKHLRLESVQNAVDQAKVAAANICGREVLYNKIPWFWSDQFDLKLQMVGLPDHHDEVIVRLEEGRENCFSVWYFKGEELLSVHAINNAKAYVLGSKFIQSQKLIDKAILQDSSTPLKPAQLIYQKIN